MRGPKSSDTTLSSVWKRGPTSRHFSSCPFLFLPFLMCYIVSIFMTHIRRNMTATATAVAWRIHICHEVRSLTAFFFPRYEP